MGKSLRVDFDSYVKETRIGSFGGCKRECDRVGKGFYRIGYRIKMPSLLGYSPAVSQFGRF